MQYGSEVVMHIGSAAWKTSRVLQHVQGKQWALGTSAVQVTQAVGAHIRTSYLTCAPAEQLDMLHCFPLP